MTPRLLMIAALSFGPLLAAPAFAQEIKPGLYQVTSKMSGNNKISDMMKQQKDVLAKMTPEQRQQMADLPRQMAAMMENMPADQREKMKAMMGKQSGALASLQSMQMTINPDGSTTAKMCVTKQMIERRNFTAQQGSCTHNVGPMVGGVMKVTYACTQPPSRGQGEMHMTGPGSFTTNMKIVSTEPGNKDTVEIDSTSTWLGADCGSVKPVDPAAFQQAPSGK